MYAAATLMCWALALEWWRQRSRLDCGGASQSISLIGDNETMKT